MSNFYQPNLSGLKRDDGSVIGGDDEVSGPVDVFSMHTGESVTFEPDPDRPKLTFDRLRSIVPEYGKRGARHFVTSERVFTEAVRGEEYERLLDHTDPLWRRRLVMTEPEAMAEFQNLLDSGMPEEQAEFQAARNHAEGQRMRKAEWLRQVEESEFLSNAPEFRGKSSGLFEDVVGTMISSAPATAATIVNPMVGVPVIYKQMHGALAGSIEEAAAAKGIALPAERVNQAASAGAMIATPLETIGELLKIKAMVGSGIWTKNLLQISEAFGGELFTELAQNYPETSAIVWALNPDLPPEKLTNHISEVILSGETFQEGLYDGLVGGLAGAGTSTVGLSIHTMAGRLVHPDQKRISDEKVEKIKELISTEQMTPEQNQEFMRLIGYSDEQIIQTAPEQIQEIVEQVKTRLLYQAAPIESDERNLLAGKMPSDLRDIYFSIWDGLARVAAQEGVVAKPEDFYKQVLSEIRFSGTIDLLAGMYNNLAQEAELNEIREPQKQIEIEFSKAPVPAPERPAAPTLSPFVFRTRMVATGHVTAGSLQIESAADAASFLAHIRKAAQENLYSVVTDEAGNILEVHRYSKGVRSASQASATEIIGRVFNTPGAKRVYVAHNHPSLSNTTPSQEDYRFLAVLRSGLALRGVQTVPIVISGTKYGTWNAVQVPGDMGVDTHMEASIPAALRRYTMPEKERFIARHGKGVVITDGQSAATAKKAAVGDAWQGFQLLSLKNEVIGYSELSIGASLPDVASKLIADIERSNASAMIYYNNGEPNATRRELLRGLSSSLVDVKLFDVIIDNKRVMKIPFSVSDSSIQETQIQGFNRLAADIVLHQTEKGKPKKEQSSEPRGAIHNLLSSMPKVIELFEKADPTTAIHETGHLILGMMYDAGSNDYTVLANWAGLDEDRAYQGLDAWTEEELERVAKAFEIYMMEGRSPTFRLQQVFQKMKKIMLQVYKSISNRYFDGIKINDEVRGVFDRWLATEQERATDPVWEVSEWLRAGELADIEAMAQEAAIKKEIGRRSIDWAEASRMEYEDLQAQARQMVAGELAKRKSKMEKDLRAQFRKEAEKSIEDDPFYQMMADIMSAGGLRLESLQALYDQAYIADVIRRRPGAVAKGGIAPDVISEQYGYPDIDGMIQDILNKPTKSEAIEEYFTGLWREYESYEHLNHADIYAEALEVEIEILNDLMGKKDPAPPRKDLKKIIRAVTGQVRTPDSRRLAEDMRRDQAVARKAWNAARQATKDELNEKFSAEKRAIAAVKKQKSLDQIAKLRIKHMFSMQLLRDHFKEQKEKEKINRRIAKIIRQKNMLPEYKAHIVNFLSRYYRIPKRWASEPPALSLDEFISAKEAEGETVEAILQLLTKVPKPKSKGDLSIDDLRNISDVVDALTHMEIKERDDMLIAQDAAYRDAVNELVGEIAGANVVTADERHPIEIARERTGFLSEARESVKVYFAQLKKVEFIVRALDGWKDFGANYRLIFEPIKKAEDQELELGREYTEKLKEAFKGFDGAWARKKYKIRGLPVLITKEEMIMAMLNSGNDGNRAALNVGNELNQEMLQEIAGRLTQDETALIHKLWDIIDSLFPKLNEVHKTLTGVTLRKVLGKYFPLVFSKKLSWRVGEFQAKREMYEMFANEYIHPEVEAGHRMERTGGKMGVELSFGVIGRHVQKVIHDITHQIPVRNAQRLILAPEYRETIYSTLGEDIYRQLMPWLQGVARPRSEPMSIIERWVGKVRRNMTVVALGLKVSTAVNQTLGIATSMNELGVIQTMKGLQKFYSDPWGWRDFIYDRSPSLRGRQRTWDRELGHLYNRFNPKELKASQVAKECFFGLIRIMDQSVALPTWLAAYDQGIDKFNDESKAVEYADGVVRRTQATASPKDLAEVQRGGELKKLFTSFYTFFSAFENLMAETHAKYGAGKMNTVGLLKSYWLLLILPAAIDNLMREREIEWKQLMAAIFTYRLNGMPFIRDFGSAFLSDYGYSLSPVEGLGKEINWAAQHIKAENYHKLPKRGLMISGYMVGLPSQALVTATDGMIDMIEGETVNPLRLFYRRKKED